MIDLSKLTIGSARNLLDNKEFSSRDLTDISLKAISRKDSEIDAFLEVFEDALIQAEEADKKIEAGIKLPLLGIPIALKDNMLVEGHKVSAGSKILENFIAPEDGTAVKKLKEAGAIIIGRTNMDEFAMGSSTENSAYQVTKNPHDFERVAGGSSGGSAAAVASNMVLGSFGSDTGGSIRQPAAFCGVVGMKPTYGRISRSGLIALASSLDQIGPFAKSVADAEILYKSVVGKDLLDSTTISDDTYKKSKKNSKIIGVPRDFVESEGVDLSVKKNFEDSLDKLRSLGYKIKDIELHHLKYSLAVYYILMPAEASSNLARFDGARYGLHVDGESGVEDYFKTRGRGFGRETRRRIILGTYVLSSGYYDEYYGRAIKMKEIITKELEEAFKHIDFIATPTTPTQAFKIGDKTSDPLSMYLADIFTVPANISGCPSISLPSGFDGKLPLGFELTAWMGEEEKLFMAGKEFMGE